MAGRGKLRRPPWPVGRAPWRLPWPAGGSSAVVHGRPSEAQPHSMADGARCTAPSMADRAKGPSTTISPPTMVAPSPRTFSSPSSSKPSRAHRGDPMAGRGMGR
ncbi:unnamed protein product [Urochloa humidicola]